MSTSLEKLVNNLAEECICNFQHLRSHVHQTHGENEDIQLELLSREGVYPYRYTDSFDRFQEEHSPPRSDFYNNMEEVIFITIWKKQTSHEIMPMHSECGTPLTFRTSANIIIYTWHRTSICYPTPLKISLFRCMVLMRVISTRLPTQTCICL